MRKHFQILYAIGVCLSLLILVSLSSTAAPQDTLRIGLDRFMSAEKFGPVAQFLSEKLGRQVKYENVNSLIDLSGNQSKYDLLYINAFGYAYARVTALPFEAYLLRADSSGTALTYKSCLIANAGSAIQSTEHIKTESAKTDLSFTYASSTSGHIIPRIYLSQLLEKSVEDGFKNVAFASGHVDVIRKVQEGSIGLGACSCQWIMDEMQKNLTLKKDINIVWESTPIPHAVWAKNKNSDPALFEDFNAALNAMNENEEVWKIISLPGMTQFSPADENAFNFLTDQLQKDQELEFYLYYYESVSE